MAKLGFELIHCFDLQPSRAFLEGEQTKQIGSPIGHGFSFVKIADEELVKAHSEDQHHSSK